MEESGEPISSGVDLDQNTILRQLEEDFNRSVEPTNVTFTRHTYREFKKSNHILRWVLVALALLLLLLAVTGVIVWQTLPAAASAPAASVPAAETCPVSDDACSMIYQLNIQAFNKDFNGLKKKLDYIEDLGAKCIVINQVSSNSIGFLDIKDSGTMSDFQDLIKAANERNMTIIVELSPAYSVYNASATRYILYH